MRSFPSAANRELAGPLLVRLRETFGSNVEIRILDPKCLFWILPVIRHKIKATEPVWILEGHCIFRGIPSWEQLRALIEQQLQTPGS
ncbi:MAG TPA: hypothetical protein PK364_03865 [Synergistaceae bacterium]|nr:hypothetical protein [Synergistaceae bacterium]HPJ24867.1 hypothetical protein [Synergistaceae bacterium]HPQ37090.1 hypothetical protein [Synergistaceae bacterium]